MKDESRLFLFILHPSSFILFGSGLVPDRLEHLFLGAVLLQGGVERPHRPAVLAESPGQVAAPGQLLGFFVMLLVGGEVDHHRSAIAGTCLSRLTPMEVHQQTGLVIVPHPVRQALFGAVLVGAQQRLQRRVGVLQQQPPAGP